MNALAIVIPTMFALFLFFGIFIFVLVFAVKNIRAQSAIGPSPARRVLRNDKGTHEGLNYDWYYSTAGRNTPPYFDIRMDCPGRGTFFITRETPVHRFFKALHINRELQTDDPQFDQAFYIESDMVESVSRLLSRGEIRALITDLSALGFTSVQMKKGRLRAVIWPCRKNPAEDPGFAPGALDLLGRLSRECGYCFQGEAVSGDSSGRAARTIFILTPILLLVAGIVSLILAFRNYRPLFEVEVFRHSLTWAVVGFNAFMLAAILALRGRARSHKDILIAFFISLFTFPVAGFGLMALANARLDTGSPTVHTAMITRKYSRSHKNKDTYHVQFFTWREERPRSLSMPHEVWDTVLEGVSAIEITTRPGRFGHEWIEEWRIISPPALNAKQ